MYYVQGGLKEMCNLYHAEKHKATPYHAAIPSGI